MEQITTPLISIVIPAFNAEDYIAETLESVSDQTFHDFECIIVDDASTDKTCEVVESFAKKDARFKIIRAKHAGRPAVPRNIGIRAATGKYIAFLDSDDLWTKNKLKDQINIFKKNATIDMVYSISVTFGDVHWFSEKFEVLPLPWKAYVSSEELISKGNSIPCSSVMVKQSIFDEVGLFDEDPKLKAEDYELWIRISKISNLYAISRLHVYYRISASQFSGDWKKQQHRIDSVAEKHPSLRTEYGFDKRNNFLFKTCKKCNSCNLLFLLEGKKAYLRLITQENMDNKIKNILIITSRADFGGGPEHIFSMLDLLSDEYRLFIATPDDYPYYDKYRSIIGKGRMITISHRKFKIKELFKLRSFCKEHFIDLIHSHGRGAGIYGRLLTLLTFRKNIHTFHGVHLEGFQGSRKILYTLIEKILCSFSTACIAVSKGEYNNVLDKKLVSAKKLHLIENGVKLADTTIFSNIARTDPLRILTITRFDYAKNPELLIEIFRMLNKNQNEYKFYLDVIGEGENAEHYSAALADEGLRDVVTFHGVHSQLDEYYLNSFCYLSTSRWEGMSLAILEAMSFGLPVVATDVRGNNDLIEHDINGYLYDISKPEDAVKFIVHAADDKEKYIALSTAARELIKTRFSVERCAKETKALYKNIL